MRMTLKRVMAFGIFTMSPVVAHKQKFMVNINRFTCNVNLILFVYCDMTDWE